jgi:hypothetical protein
MEPPATQELPDRAQVPESTPTAPAEATAAGISAGTTRTFLPNH